MKKALDPQVKKASQAAVNKIKNDIKNKQNQAKNMTPKKETEVRYVKETSFDGLKELVEMKKQKAVANELDTMIFEQNKEKERRTHGTTQEKERVPSPIEIWIAENPDKLKNMSQEEVTKLSMIINPSGGSDLSTLMTIMNMKGNNNGDGKLSEKILGLMVEKMFKNEGSGKSGNGEMDIIKMMMQQNMKTQEMIMNMVIKQNAPQKETQTNTFMKEIFGMVKSQSDFENSMLREKIKDIELRQNQTDPLGEAKRMMDYINTFKPLLGGGNATPEAMNHELKLKEMAFDHEKVKNDEAHRVANMNQIGDMINNTVETLGKVFGEPVAEAAKAKIEQYTENVKNPPPERKKKNKMSPETLRQEIDLGKLEELEDLEEELAQYDQKPIEETPQKRSRFKVSESGK